MTEVYYLNLCDHVASLVTLKHLPNVEHLLFTVLKYISQWYVDINIFEHSSLELFAFCNTETLYALNSVISTVAGNYDSTFCL